MKTKKFIITKFSHLTDTYDAGITAKEIENMLNQIESQRIGYTKNCARWKVKESKKT